VKVFTIFSRYCDIGGSRNNNNDTDRRLGLTAVADQPDYNKYSEIKVQYGNE